MNKETIMITADKLLQKTDIYSLNNRNLITNIFNSHNTYDMLLNVEVITNEARLFILERGECIWEHRTEREEPVIYAIIANIINIITDRLTYDNYMDTNGHCSYSPETRFYNRQLKDEAFMKIGAPYESWYKQGITIWSLDKIIL